MWYFPTMDLRFFPRFSIFDWLLSSNKSFTLTCSMTVSTEELVRWTSKHCKMSFDVAPGKIPFFVLPFVMKLFSSLIRIPLGILSVNIKVFLWPFYGREASLNNLLPGMTGNREKSVCLVSFTNDYWREFWKTAKRIFSDKISQLNN